MPAQIHLLENAEITWTPPDFSKKYIVSENETNTDTEKMVLKVVHHFFGVSYGFETFAYKYVVEMFFATDIPNFYNRDGEYPLLSLVLFLNDGEKAIFTEGFSFDKYKFKDIQNLTNGLLCDVKSYKIVKYDTASYVGLVKPSSVPMILFYVWKKEKILKDVLPLPCNVFNIRDNLNIRHVPVKNTCQIFETDVETLIYEKKNVSYNTEVIDTYFSAKPSEERIEFVKEKYGEYLLPFFDAEKYPITQNNPFYKNKIYKKTLSTDVCYWMIYEYERNEHLVSLSPYKNYQNCLKIDELPSLYSFVSFVSNHLLDRAQKDYGIYEKKIIIHKTDVFICKYTGKKTFNPKEDTLNQQVSLLNDMATDDTFLSINIVLNDPIDYKGNEIVFENMIDQRMVNNDNTIFVLPEMFSKEHCLEQGDMIIYNGNAKRTRGQIISGSKYVLVIMTKIIA